MTHKNMMTDNISGLNLQLFESFPFLLSLLFMFTLNPAVPQPTKIVFKSMDQCPSDPPFEIKATGKFQTFLTPGYRAKGKGKYRNNLDCHWFISASSQHHRIQLIVHDSLLEDRLFTKCDDFIEVRDGSNANSTLISKWCGYTNPLSMTSSMDKLHIHFKTDMGHAKKGANISFVEYAMPGCPPGWVSKNEYCYQLFSPELKSTWLQAQYHCTNDRSNLLTVTSQEEYTNILSHFAIAADDDPPWIGFHDATEEGKFEPVDPTATPWPSPFPQFPDSHELEDCVYLDLRDSNTAYNVDDCRNKRSFICKKRKDGTTASYPPPEAAIRQGLVGTAGLQGPIWLWLLIAVILLFLLLILIPVCIRKSKRRKSRVHSGNKGLLRIEKLEKSGDTSDDPVRSVSRIVERSSNLGETMETSVHLGNGSVIPNGHRNSQDMDKIETFHQNEREITEKFETAETVESLQAAPTRPLPPIIHNGQLSNGRPKTGVRTSGMGVPPLDRFDRPHIRLLDNVSAISLDEFWNKVVSDSKKIKHIQVTPDKNSVNQEQTDQ